MTVIDCLCAIQVVAYTTNELHLKMLGEKDAFTAPAVLACDVPHAILTGGA
jgi:hypothetical protein